MKMSKAMRCKVQVASVRQDGPTQQTVTFNAVSRKTPYAADGLDEDNTFAKFTPMATLSIAICNPALHDKYALGDQFYVDFTPITPAD